MSRFSRYHMVFDVESVGLQGEGFAVAYCVYDIEGEALEWRLYACDRNLANPMQRPSFFSDREYEERFEELVRVDREWIQENVPALQVNCDSPRQVRQRFWEDWMRLKNNLDVTLWAWCGWPVEARFLIQCVEDDIMNRQWEGPFPLHEITTLVKFSGCNVEKENPKDFNYIKHHPMSDVSFSADVLLPVIRELNFRK
jgi:hypothetical protein